MTESRSFELKFNIPGILRMLGTNIYSEPQVCVREMIQNAHDSSIARQIECPSFDAPEIHIGYSRAQRLLTIEDKGSGLTEEEIHRYLSTIGSGRTQELREILERQDIRAAQKLIGQFGLGLLSAFSIAERVEITTRSYQEGSEGLHWTCAGDVEYQLRPAPDAEVGTRVEILVQPEHVTLLTDEELRRTIKQYADLLEIPIYLGADRKRVNSMGAPWTIEATEVEYREYVASRFDVPALEVIPLDVQEDGVTLRGVLYVPKSSVVSIGEYGDLDVYIRGMFIKSRDTNLLPRWAKFVRGLVDSPSLTPTVSRDEIIRDGTYHKVRALLGEAVLGHLEMLAREDPRQLRAIVVGHNTLIKAWALESEEFFGRIAPFVEFETDVGRLTIPRYLERVSDGRTLYFFKEAGSGTQQKVLFGAKNLAVIDASYGADEAFLRRYADVNPEVRVRRLDAEADFIFQSVDADAAWQTLEDQYRMVHRIEARVVAFDPIDLPAVLIEKQSSDQSKLLDSLLSSESVGEELRALLGTIKDEQERSSKSLVSEGSLLNLNARNPVIRRLRDLDPSSEVLNLALIVLYNNAVLFSQHAITAENAIKMCQSNNRAVGLMIDQAVLLKDLGEAETDS